MYHLILDVRVSRRLTAHFVIDGHGRTIGQHRHVGDALDQLFELEPDALELHTATQVLTAMILTTAQKSADATTLHTGLPLPPWQTEAEIEG